MEGKSMNLTDQEIFYKCLADSKPKEVIFPQMDVECVSYFGDMETQPALLIYNPENINDVTNMMDSILTEEEFEGIKKECIRTIMMSIIEYRRNGETEIKGNKKMTVPEFIYNF